MRLILSFVLPLLCAVLSWEAQAEAARKEFNVPTPSGSILVELVTQDSKPGPAVILLSGSKGFGASAYDDIAQTFGAAGLDVFLVHYLAPADIDAISSAKSASARVQYYVKRLPDWIEAVQATVAYLRAQPRHAGKVGVVGISLGAQVATAATANATDVDGLILVDGGFPNDYSQPVRSMPPLQIIWGSADRTFPLSVGQKLQKSARKLGGPVRLDVYKGGAHDFFLKAGTRQAKAAHQSAAEFLKRQLSD
jgi:dienelactone hydrolase